MRARVNKPNVNAKAVAEPDTANDALAQLVRLLARLAAEADWRVERQKEKLDGR